MQEKEKYLICLGCGKLYGKKGCRCFPGCGKRTACLDLLDGNNKAIEGYCPACHAVSINLLPAA